MVADLVAGVLLWLGVGVLLLAALGTAAFRDPLDRLHYVGAAAMVGLPLVVAALVVTTPSSGPKLVLIGLFTVVTAPVLTAATARAAVRQGGDREGDR